MRCPLLSAGHECNLSGAGPEKITLPTSWTFLKGERDKGQ